MVEAYVKYFKNYANFKGRSTRSDYWYVVLANFLIGLVLGFVCGLIGQEELGTKISSLYSLITLIPGLAIFTRRMHDINKSGWAWAWCLLPFVGWVVVLVFLCTKSVNEGNKYASLEDAPVAEVKTEENV